jgi:ParB-like nuclease domain
LKTPFADPGPKPQFKWLPIEELFVDVRYQRGTGSERSRKNLKHMKQSFTWSACGALIVSLDPVKKKYAIIDGQHRMAAAKQRGDIKEMPCLIVDRAQMKEQAESFVSINTKRVNLGKLQTFPAAIAAGDETAVSIKQILDESRITIPRYPAQNGQTGPRETCALSAVASLLGAHSKNQIKWVLTIIPDAYGEEKGQMRSMLIKTLAIALKQDPKLDGEAMIEALRQNDPEDLQINAAACVKAQGSRALNYMVDILMRSYQAALRKRQRAA